jgi:hypothetical protein
MNTYRLIRLLLSVSMLCSIQSIAQVSYTNWNFLMRATNSQLTDSLAMPGVRSDATSDYDNQYDIPRPPRSPSGTYLEIYFPHSGGNYPPILGTKYAIDYQGPNDPSWNMSVEASSTGPLTLSWDSAYVNSIEPRVQLFLLDLSNSALTNMRVRGSYTFNYTSKRNFQIIGSIKVNLEYLMEGFWSGTTQVQDTVTGYLAASTSPFGFVDSAKVYLATTGAGMLTFPNAATGSYYLVIRHRNHLEVWTPTPLALTRATTSFSSYDFTTGAGQAYGIDALKQIGGVYVSWAGDVNQDGVVDFLDRNLTWNNRTQTGYLSTDCNGDNVTDASDGTLVLNNRLKVRQHP